MKNKRGERAVGVSHFPFCLKNNCKCASLFLFQSRVHAHKHRILISHSLLTSLRFFSSIVSYWFRSCAFYSTRDGSNNDGT